VIGDRSEKTCRRLWNKVPTEYRNCISYSDFWDAYQKVLPQKTLHAVGKESVGIALCANIRLAMFARHFRFQNVTLFTTWLPNALSLTII
jgi:insertion element IS1 protein InsB